MRQKYIIFKDRENNELKISEYAIIDKELKRSYALMAKSRDYALIGREKYDQKAVMQSIPKGREAVMGLLRTHNLFPIEPYAREIAETVMTLYSSSNGGTVELTFDDVELLQEDQAEETVS